MIVHGLLNLNKPAGPTSMDMVRQIKRLTGVRKTGHGGTLDPIASGVLPICLGQATRLMSYLVDSTKVYEARLRLGVATDTFDSTGAVTGTADPSGVTREAFEAAMEDFRGPLLQVPPMYSALKKGGERLYELARAGVDVEREPRPVEVMRLELKDWAHPEATIEVECGRGLYVRSLAHDLGQALGCGAHLTGLVRLRAGPFSVDDAVTLEELEDAATAGRWQGLLSPLDAVVQHLPAAVVSPALASSVRQGRRVALGMWGGASAQPQGPCRLYTTDGRLVALASYKRDMGLWQPTLVFDSASQGAEAADGYEAA